MTVSNMDRRTFVKGATAATAALGALSLAGCSENKLAETTPEVEAFVSNEEGAEWIPVSCWHNCGGRCLNKVLVKDGTVLRQKTDDTHEDSWDHPQSRGCIRGRSVQQQVFGADRVKYPMKRKNWSPDNPNGELRGRDEWERISWDEALDYIAGELKKAKEKYGNRSIMYMNEVNLEGYLGGVLEAFGGYLDMNACQSDGTFQYAATGMMGLTYSPLNDRYDTLKNTDHFVMWGHNPAWAAFGNPSFYVKHFKQKGMQFVFVGPDYNASAGYTDAEWIPVRPGGDTALILGVAHSMLSRDRDGSLIDWDFLNRCTVGFDAEHMPADAKTEENFRDYVMGKYDGVEKTPEWASEICGTPVEKIHRLADILGCKNNCYISSNGAPARAKGAENFPQALMAIGAMGGHYGKPGNACGLDHNYSTFNRGANIVQSAAPGGVPFCFNAHNPVEDVIPYNVLWDAVLTGKYYDGGSTFTGAHEPIEREIDVHVIMGEVKNILQTQVNTNKGIEAFRKVDFVCTQVYTMKTDSRYADIVLPICTRWEYDTSTFYDAAYDKENIFAHRKAVDPLYESRTDWQIAEALSERLGLDFKQILPFTDQQLWMNAMAWSTVMKEDGSEMEPLLTITKEDYEKYGVEGEPQEGRITLEQFLTDGVYRVKRSEDDPFVEIGFKAFRDDPEKNPLETSVSGKLEIYCQAKGDYFDMMRGGLDNFEVASPLPKYMEQHEGYTDSFTDWENKVKGPYPFQMTHVHYLRRAHSDMDNLPWLREAMTNPVFINADDAKEKGIQDGDVILVKNDNGSFIRPATVTRTVMPGVILVPHGAAARVDGETGIDIGGADNILTSSGKETSILASGWNSTLVDYEKYDGPIELLPDCEWELDIPIADAE